MKRITVRRMLKNRLADSRAALNYAYQHDDLVDVLGGRPSDNQFKVNMKKDIKDLEYLIKCLEDRDELNNIKSNLKKVTTEEIEKGRSKDYQRIVE